MAGETHFPQSFFLFLFLLSMPYDSHSTKLKYFPLQLVKSFLNQCDVLDVLVGFLFKQKGVSAIGHTTKIMAMWKMMSLGIL
jgi:hypothetical protein